MRAQMAMAVFAAAVPFGLAAQTPRPIATDTATMIIRLGTDTIAVERWERTADRLEVTYVGRSPSVAVRRYALRFGDDGRVTHVATASGDAALQERAVDSGAVPVSGALYAPYAVALGQAWRADAGEIDVPMLIGPEQRAVPIRRVAAATYELPNQFGVPMTARLDTRGRVLAIDAGGGATVERVAPVDLAALTADWRARDARGEGLGPLSPRETVEGTVSGARVSVAYGRPAARGRPVMGGLVPYDEVWRTGANEETLLTIGQPFEIGGLRLEPGTYSLFTIPGREEWQLIVNRQTGQGGLGHDAAHDVGRVSMRVRALPQPVERFTIAIRDDADRGMLTFSWEQIEAAVPIRPLAR